ncbi:tripartite tricarboxylate transporter TctB family protein [Allonocardiopsis opalescens]|uniref:Tripartite tricarboxylate transporter TctB family protein n=1 Tax=Allonocardiopsis opalescens TaxID=1144618 RepID=A0A2T0QEN9_9ACTN|nr:tripartite tricarboxylate transporter TctB family protein [Allonocardiopsis opalescens]PRY02406.1 tripartite tricarboxylate transporter TctB family protein [Allonocardiopsis opalescens]
MPVEPDERSRTTALRSPDAVLGLSLIAISVVFLACTLPLSAAAAAWPRAVLALLLFLGAAITVRAVRAAAAGRPAAEPAAADAVPDEEEGASGEWSPAVLRRPALTMLIVIGYVALLDVIGFFPATVLYLVGHLWFGGSRDLRVVAGVTAGLCGLVYLLFVHELSVPLPTGLFG